MVALGRARTHPWPLLAVPTQLDPRHPLLSQASQRTAARRTPGGRHGRGAVDAVHQQLNQTWYGEVLHYSDIG